MFGDFCDRERRISYIRAQRIRFTLGITNLFSNATTESEPGSTAAKSRQADGRGCEDKTGNGRRTKRQKETVGSYCGHIVTGLDFQGDDGRIISTRFDDFLDWIACP